MIGTMVLWTIAILIIGFGVRVILGRPGEPRPKLGLVIDVVEPLPRDQSVQVSENIPAV
jgi:hypothetical protein